MQKLGIETVEDRWKVKAVGKNTVAVDTLDTICLGSESHQSSLTGFMVGSANMMGWNIFWAGMVQTEWCGRDFEKVQKQISAGQASNVQLAPHDKPPELLWWTILPLRDLHDQNDILPR